MTGPTQAEQAGMQLESVAALLHLVATDMVHHDEEIVWPFGTALLAVHSALQVARQMVEKLEQEDVDRQNAAVRGFLAETTEDDPAAREEWLRVYAAITDPRMISEVFRFAHEAGPGARRELLDAHSGLLRPQGRVPEGAE